MNSRKCDKNINVYAIFFSRLTSCNWRQSNATYKMLIWSCFDEEQSWAIQKLTFEVVEGKEMKIFEKMSTHNICIQWVRIAKMICNSDADDDDLHDENNIDDDDENCL